MPFTYLLFFISLLLLIKAVFSKKGVYRSQILVLLIALLALLAVDIVYVTGHSPIPDFNLSGIVFSFSGLLIAFSLKRQKFLDLMPAARSALVESMEDGWIMLDARGRIKGRLILIRDIISTLFAGNGSAAKSETVSLAK